MTAIQMQRRIFVADSREDSELLALLGQWAQQYSGAVTIEDITSGTDATPFLRVTLTYDSELLGDQKVPKYTSRTPFTLPIVLDQGETYTPSRARLDCALLSAYSYLPVTIAQPSNIEGGVDVGFFLTGGEPLWIDPNEWSDYASLINNTRGRGLVSDSPVFDVALAMAKYDGIKTTTTAASLNGENVPVWSAADDKVALERKIFAPYLERLANVYRLPLPPEGTTERSALHELVTAFELPPFVYETEKLVTTTIKPCNCGPSATSSDGGCVCGALDEKKVVKTRVELPLSKDALYLILTPPFTYDWVYRSLDYVLNGLPPPVLLTLTEADGIGKVSETTMRHNFLQSYVNSPARVYLTPGVMDAVSVECGEKECYVSFLADSLRTYASILKGLKPWTNFNEQEVKTVDEGLTLRYRLSKSGIRSLLQTSTDTDDEGKDVITYAVTWEGKEPLTPLATDAAALHGALIGYLRGIAREASSAITGTMFAELRPEELVDVVVTRQRNAYESSALRQLVRVEDPLNRQPLTPLELERISYGPTGFFTIGPLLGLLDEVPLPQAVAPLDGVIVADVQPYITEDAVTAAQLDGTNPQPTPGYKEVTYSVAMMDGVQSFLFNLIAADAEIKTVDDLVSRMWLRGDFLSLWARAYIRYQRMMSHVMWSVPPIIRDAMTSINDSKRAIAYLKLLA